MHKPSIITLAIASSLLAAHTKPLSNSDVFSLIHTKKIIHFEMELGFFEFRIYRDSTNPAVFLLEYRSETGKAVVFECDAAFQVIHKVKGTELEKNGLEMLFKCHRYRYSGSMNALYNED